MRWLRLKIETAWSRLRSESVNGASETHRRADKIGRVRHQGINACKRLFRVNRKSDLFREGRPKGAQAFVDRQGAKKSRARGKDHVMAATRPQG